MIFLTSQPKGWGVVFSLLLETLIFFLCGSSPYTSFLLWAHLWASAWIIRTLPRGQPQRCHSQAREITFPRGQGQHTLPLKCGTNLPEFNISITGPKDIKIRFQKNKFYVDKSKSHEGVQAISGCFVRTKTRTMLHSWVSIWQLAFVTVTHTHQN